MIVGGGIAGLTAAYELSRTPELRQRYEVSVHQMGFRLGGKLASGRNRAQLHRNEEHGLHVWFGFYDNTFRLADEVYRRWRSPAGCPFGNVWDIVVPHHHGLLGRRQGDGYEMVAMHFPRTPDVPGTGAPHPSALGLVAAFLDATRALVASAAGARGRTPSVGGWPERAARGLWPGHRSSGLWAAPDGGDTPLRTWQRAVTRLGHELARRARATPRERRVALARAAERLLRRSHPPLAAALERITRRSPDARPAYQLVDVTLAFLRGLLAEEDGVYLDGDLDRLNDRDFRQWIRSRGCSEESARECPWVEALYDSSFQFGAGDRDDPTFEAGTAARFAIRAYLGYKHCPVYLLQAGMGEALIAPLYEVLCEQGVSFRFFHRLDRMELSADGRRLERLRFAEQARARCGPYAPLFTYRGLRCWPTEPDWDQLEDGDAMRAAGVDFESRWSPPARERPEVLERGRDFDRVVLALPLGSIAPDADGHTPCAEWLEAAPHIRAAAHGINLVPSVSVQLWLDRNRRELGWDRRPAALGWAPPASIFCDMSHVIAHEGWDPRHPPKAAIYMCGAGGAEAVTTPSSAAGAREAARRRVLETIREQLQTHGPAMWPGTRGPDGRFDWNALHDPTSRVGAERLEAQLVRVNAEPWDLCDCAGVGQGRLRPEAHQSGLDNVALAGTWTRTSVGTSAVETAVMSGMAAARALGVEEREIAGESFLCRPPSRQTLPMPTRQKHEIDDVA